VVSRKVAVLGFRAVGKSSLTNSFVTGIFSEVYDPTIESTHHKTIRFRKVHFATDIVDTAGMVSSGSLTRWRLNQSKLVGSLDASSRVSQFDASLFIGRVLAAIKKCFPGSTWLCSGFQHSVAAVL
jgi:small GTP-binding protein